MNTFSYSWFKYNITSISLISLCWFQIGIVYLANIYIVFIMICVITFSWEKYYFSHRVSRKKKLQVSSRNWCWLNGRPRKGEEKETLPLKDHLAFIHGELCIWESYADLLIHLQNPHFHWSPGADKHNSKIRTPCFDQLQNK